MFFKKIANAALPYTAVISMSALSEPHFSSSFSSINKVERVDLVKLVDIVGGFLHRLLLCRVLLEPIEQSSEMIPVGLAGAREIS